MYESEYIGEIESILKNALYLILRNIQKKILCFRIAKYPSADQSDALSITINDLNCLKDCEFLNDNIISFYLKYVHMFKFKHHFKHFFLILDIYSMKISQKQTAIEHTYLIHFFTFA